MSLLVREALVNCAYARADEHYVLTLARLRNLGIDTGGAVSTQHAVIFFSCCALFFNIHWLDNTYRF
jgi:hypothetical protein